MKKLIDVPQEVMECLREEAKRLGISMNALINLILHEYARITKEARRSDI